MEDAAVRFIDLLKGKRLTRFCCTCEMLVFDFAPLALHAMGCSRIIKNNDILVTVPDYQSWDQVESTHNDEWFNMKKFNSEIVGGGCDFCRDQPLTRSAGQTGQWSYDRVSDCKCLSAF